VGSSELADGLRPGERGSILEVRSGWEGEMPVSMIHILVVGFPVEEARDQAPGAFMLARFH